jgi:uncharacterized membrane protein (UPF0127 family)
MSKEMQNKETVKTRLALSLIALAVVAVSAGIFGIYSSSECGVKYSSRISDNSETRMKGLSGTECLGENDAMLFVFDAPGDHGIWMKDMKFAIDIVWLDDSRRVVAIKEDASPDSYPEVFYPKTQTRYVVELPAGTVSRDAISVGDAASWE